MYTKLFFLKFLGVVAVALLVIPLPCLGQTGQIFEVNQTLSSMLSNYVSYHNSVKENIYAQLNKSVYLAGEELWFKLYITNTKTGLPEFTTNKAYTDLYAPDGSLYTRKIWQAQDGCAYGQINLPDTLPGGTYTFKAYTNWQQNFEPERMFSAQVQIKNFDSYIQTALPATTLLWDIQFFPEGGDLIAGTTSRIAVKGVNEYGKGERFSGNIVSKRDTIASFETNELGMGSFVLSKEYAGVEGLYAVVLLPSGTTQQVPLPKAKELGISIQVNAMRKDRTDIFLNTNALTIQKFSGLPLYCMVHQNGKVAEVYQIHTLDNLLTKLQLFKKELPAGINTVTLFDPSFRPIAERLFFVEKEEAIGSVNITAVKLRDSVEVRLTTTDTKGNMVSGLLSASVLPSSTVADDFTSNIYAHLFLATNVRGEVENPAYYFEERSVERLQALDNLLLTQAWKKYEWNTMLNQNISQRTFHHLFEYGFQVSGRVLRQYAIGNQPAQRSEVVLYMATEPYIRYAPIATNGYFFFDSLLIYNPSNKIFIIAMNQRGGENRRLQNVTTVTPMLSNIIQTKPSTKKESDTDEEDDSQLRFFDPNATLLAAATVTARKPTARDVMRGDIYVSSNDRYYEITGDNLPFYQTPADVLRSVFGFQIKRDSVGELLVTPRRLPGSLNTLLSDPDDWPPPTLIIDGFPAMSWSAFDVLTIDDIEAISVNNGTNHLLGSDGYYGSVHVKTRSKPLRLRNEDHLRNFAQLVVEGYENPIAYYTPSYHNILNRIYLSPYVCLHWAPNLVSIDGESVFRFYAPFAEQCVRMRIEGVAIDGVLFSHDAEIEIKY